ncbi:MAG TPA: hypothetical protein VME43_33140 [Bryobacteraceae bacterium]|nr:hypothetical protein [Bryobacteraceae bacterium]
MDLGSFAPYLYAFFVSLGGFGLLLMGVMDSSFLFMPLGNDLLVLALCARDHARLPFYAAMAAAGSVLGCLLVDLAVRNGGERELEKHLSGRKADYIKARVRRRAGFGLAFASLMPPPFPFTPFVIAAAALQYPRRRLFTVIAGARYLRFSAEGILGIIFGRQILRLGEARWARNAIVLLLALAIGGSVVSIVRWIRNKHKA